jgi:hypothetical protein
VRLLGLELGEVDCGKGPKCQRFAAIMEDGILLKLVGGPGLAPCGVGRDVCGAGWLLACALCWARRWRETPGGGGGWRSPSAPLVVPPPAAQKVEAAPADLKVTDAQNMLELWRDCYDC